MNINFETFAFECFNFIYDDDIRFFNIITNEQYQKQSDLKKEHLLNLIKDINTNVYHSDIIMFVLDKMFITNHTYKKINHYISEFINLIDFLFKNNNLTIDFQTELINCYKHHNIKHLQYVFWKTDKLDPIHKYNYKFYIKKIQPLKIKKLLQKETSNNYENYLLKWLLNTPLRFISPKKYNSFNKILELLLKFNKIEKQFLEKCYNDILNNEDKIELENIVLKTMKIYLI
jgi:hypothetical protein